VKLCELNEELLAVMITEDMINEAYQEALNELNMQDVKDGISKVGDTVKAKVDSAKDTVKKCLDDTEKCKTDVKTAAVETAQKAKAYIAKQASYTKQMTALLNKGRKIGFDKLEQKEKDLIKTQALNLVKIVVILLSFAIPIPGATVAVLKAAAAAISPASIYPTDISSDASDMLASVL
jgi:hypothetical protein